MTTATPLRICTISPVRSPVNLHSERATTTDLALPLEGAPYDSVFDDVFHPSPLEWENGMRTVGNDSLPSFFQPLFKRVMKPEARGRAEAFAVARGLCVVCAELYVFDDTVSLIRLDFAVPEGGETAGFAARARLDTFDEDVTALVRGLYGETVFPSFCRAARTIGGVRDHGLRFIDPQDFVIFKGLAFDGTAPVPQGHFLWTGRAVIADPGRIEPDQKAALLRWAGCSKVDFRPLGDHQAFIAPGNSVAFAADVDEASCQWFRALAVCQVYNAILSIFGTILKQAFLDLNRLESPDRFRSSHTRRMLDGMTRRLDHLSFVSLEFEDAMRGAQSVRRAIVLQTVESWQLSSLEAGTARRVGVIRDRLQRLTERHRIRQNRAIEMILAAIGGVTVLDFVLNLVANAENMRGDSVPGPVDLVRLLPPDGALLLALAFVAFFALYVYHGRK